MTPIVHMDQRQLVEHCETYQRFLDCRPNPHHKRLYANLRKWVSTHHRGSKYTEMYPRWRETQFVTVPRRRLVARPQQDDDDENDGSAESKSEDGEVDQGSDDDVEKELQRQLAQEEAECNRLRRELQAANDRNNNYQQQLERKTGDYDRLQKQHKEFLSVDPLASVMSHWPFAMYMRLRNPRWRHVLNTVKVSSMSVKDVLSSLNKSIPISCAVSDSDRRPWPPLAQYVGCVTELLWDIDSHMWQMKSHDVDPTTYFKTRITVFERRMVTSGVVELQQLVQDTAFQQDTAKLLYDFHVYNLKQSLTGLKIDKPAITQEVAPYGYALRSEARIVKASDEIMYKIFFQLDTQGVEGESQIVPATDIMRYDSMIGRDLDEDDNDERDRIKELIDPNQRYDSRFLLIPYKQEELWTLLVVDHQRYVMTWFNWNGPSTNPTSFTDQVQRVFRDITRNSNATFTVRQAKCSSKIKSSHLLIAYLHWFKASMSFEDCEGDGAEDVPDYRDSTIDDDWATLRGKARSFLADPVSTANGFVRKALASTSPSVLSKARTLSSSIDREPCGSLKVQTSETSVPKADDEQGQNSTNNAELLDATTVLVASPPVSISTPLDRTHSAPSNPLSPVATAVLHIRHRRCAEFQRLIKEKPPKEQSSSFNDDEEGKVWTWCSCPPKLTHPASDAPRKRKSVEEATPQPAAKKIQLLKMTADQVDAYLSQLQGTAYNGVFIASKSRQWPMNLSSLPHRWWLWPVNVNGEWVLDVLDKRFYALNHLAWAGSQLNEWVSPALQHVEDQVELTDTVLWDVDPTKTSQYRMLSYIAAFVTACDSDRYGRCLDDSKPSPEGVLPQL